MWERGDRGVKEVSTEIENQRSEKRRIEQARLCSRSTGGEGRSAARSAGVHDVHMVSPVDRPVDRGKERSTGPVDRLKAGCSRLGAVDRRGGPLHGSVDRPDAFSSAFWDSDSFSG